MRFRLFITLAGFLLTSCGGGGGPASRLPTQPAPAAEAPSRIEPVPGLETPVEEGEFRVALLLPLTGPNAGLGQAFLAAAQLALFDVDHPNLTILPRDVGDGSRAAEAARAAIGDGAQLILGPIFSQSVQDAGAVARAAHVVLVGFSNDRTIAGNGIYLTGFTPLEEVRRVISYAVAQGHMSLAALIPETPYGDAVASAFRDSVTAAGARISSMVTYPPQRDALFDPVKALADYDRRRQALENELADLRAMGDDDDLAKQELNRLKNRETLGALPFDAVLIPEGGGLLRALSPLLPYYEIDPDTIKFLGTALWDDPSLSREPPLEGAWFAAPPDEMRTRFETRFRSLYGDAPPRIASLAYDAVALSASLGLPRADQLHGQPLPERLLLNPNGFQGIDGIFRFTPAGLAERGLAVKEITKDGIKTISPAPTTFQAQGF
jgi:ABC-type branched-subunit amino acid transport system substrate-binding protein